MVTSPLQRKKLNSPLAPYLFVGPAMLILLAFKLIPILVSIYGSLFTTGAKNVRIFVGLENYAQLFVDPIFYKSLWKTVFFNLVATPLEIILAFVLALVFNQPLKGIKIYRTLMYLPVTVSLVMAMLVWGLMLNPYNGLVNSILGLLGIANQPFFTSSSQALGTVVLIAVWKGTPYWMMFLLAGLQSIPESVYEAAKIDGSKGLNLTIKIIIPMMKNSFGFVMISNTISNLLLFAPMYIQTLGGPQNATNVLMYEAYKSAYSYANLGRAYSIVVLLLLVSVAVVWIQNTFFKVSQ